MKKIEKDFKIDIMRDGQGYIKWRYSQANSNAYNLIPNFIWAIIHRWHYEYIDITYITDDYYLLHESLIDKIVDIHTYNDLSEIIERITEEKWKEKYQPKV